MVDPCYDDTKIPRMVASRGLNYSARGVGDTDRRVDRWTDCGEVTGVTV